MAPSTPLHLLFLLLLLLLLQTQSSFSLTCTTQTLTKNRLYSNCIDLPVLSSYLHWTYSSTNSSLSIAFISIPSSSNGWVAWAINPTSNKMKGSQALIAFKQDNGAMTVKTFNISSYQSIAPSKIDFEVPEMEAEIVNGVMRIYAKILLGKNVGSVLNQVWQVGGSVSGGIPDVHAFKAENLNSIGTLDLMSGGGTSGSGGGGAAGVDSRLKKRNIHGILNAVSWGIMFPVGVIIARYLRTFQSADPAWFYLHVSCQISAYAIGVAGWATGLKLGKQSEGITHTTHRNLGITLFCFATLQVFALLLRPQKDHKFRIYWKFYHHGIGYAVVVLGILNVFAGLDILEPEKKWKRAYIAVLVVLGVIALLLEPITWCIVLKRKSHKSTKPYDAPNGS